jgi:hypothetical protein
MNNTMALAEGMSQRVMRFYVKELCYESLRDSAWTGFFRSSKETLKEVMWTIIKQGDQSA